MIGPSCRSMTRFVAATSSDRLDDAYVVSVLCQNVINAAPSRTIGVSTMHEYDVLHRAQSPQGSLLAGADPKVRALVYFAALQPDVGETTNQLAASMPGEIPSSDLKPTSDGFIFIDPSKYPADVATDLAAAQ